MKISSPEIPNSQPSESFNKGVPLVAITAGLPLGGSSTFLVNLAKAFQERGLVLPVISLSEKNELTTEFAAAGARVVTISQRKHIYEDRLELAYQETARWKPRAILACLGGESFEVTRLVPPSCLRIGIIQSHDPGPYSGIRKYSAWIDAMVGVSSEISRHLATLPEFSHHRIETIPYGISFNESFRHKTRHLTDPLRIIYLGRMVEEQKRVSRLVELVKLLEQRGGNVFFTFAGDGAQLSDIKVALADSKIVKFLGDVPNHTVQTLLANQDVFVLLSDFEGLPLTLLEAMGQGVVPVVSDLESGIREAVKETCGIKVPIGDVLTAANAILDLNQNRERLQMMGQAASTFVRSEFTAKSMAEKYLRLVDSSTKTPAFWPEKISIPTPLGLSPFLFSGLPRIGRRFLKKHFVGLLPARKN